MAAICSAARLRLRGPGTIAPWPRRSGSVRSAGRPWCSVVRTRPPGDRSGVVERKAQSRRRSPPARICLGPTPGFAPARARHPNRCRRRCALARRCDHGARRQRSVRVTRFVLFLAIAFALDSSGCESKISSPFATAATPALQERFLSECSKREDSRQRAPGPVPPTTLLVGSTDRRGWVSLDFDADTNEISSVDIQGIDYRWFLGFVADVVVPMLKPAQRRFITKNVLENKADDLNFARLSRSEGDIYFRPPAAEQLCLTLDRNSPSTIPRSATAMSELTGAVLSAVNSSSSEMRRAVTSSARLR